MSNQVLSCDSILVLLQQYFANYPQVQKIALYKNVAYIEIKTSLLFFAIEFRENGNIELVFRDNETLKHFSSAFNYPFTKGTMIYIGNNSVNPVFYPTERLPVDNSHALIIKACQIFNKCLEVEESELLGASFLELKRLNETAIIQLRNDVFLDMNSFMQGRLLSMVDTMEKIKNENLSIARFGDGEINCMVTTAGCGFQAHNWKLLRELREISSQESDLLVCYPSLMVENSWWATYWPKYWSKCKFFLQKQTYGDSFITRPDAFYMYGQQMVDLWKMVWSNKNVCFITGEGSRMNASHIIFDNMKASQHIHSKSRNAYDDIDNVIEKCKLVKNVDMFLIALGPTGTVLASRLHKLGYRALDIGHLNNSYDTVFNNAPRPERQ